jgi:predicted nuclease with TOPRIM domain
MGDGIVERLTELEVAVKRAAEALAQMREENAQLKREVRRLGDERRQVLNQVDTILKDISKLDLDRPHERPQE